MEQALLEQYLSTGKLPDPNDLPYKMYAVIEKGIVKGYRWDNTPEDGVEYVLMTYDNSPAWVNGRYENGKFYKPEGEANG